MSYSPGPGPPPATLLTPGHPLLDTLVDIVLERYRDHLRRGAILVDEADDASGPRLLFAVESAITDGRTARDGSPRVVSRRVGYLEIDAAGHVRDAGPAPYLDYRPLREEERAPADTVIARHWDTFPREEAATAHAIEALVGPHLEEVRRERVALVDRTMREVHARLTAEIQYWDYRAEDLRRLEEAGKKPRLNSEKARERSDRAQERLQRRMRELELEKQIAARHPLIHCAAVVLPAAMLRPAPAIPADDAATRETRRLEAVAMAHVMAAERAAGREPRDVSSENRGWDIESREPGGDLRFIEVKGRRTGATTVTVTRNELLTCLNLGDRYHLAIVIVDGDRVVDFLDLPNPLRGDWSFGLTSANVDIGELRRAAPVPART